MFLVGGNKNGVAMRVLILPQWGQMNVSVIHTACSTEITRSIESCNSGVVNEDLTIELWTATEWDSHGIELIIQVHLLKEKLPYQYGQLRLLNISCQICYVFWVLPFYHTNKCRKSNKP